jgi:hypothetical protein
MSEVLASRSLANQALNNLVNQFARPLDFLRELVQNSLDAGTPRVEVSVEHAPGDDGHGVLSIHVTDFGEGMDEAIIDQQLTRLFSSTKEDDLTKIGKFGIGFTSIFAIRPDAVLVHTGRHGEFWELLFHPDRSFEKVRVEKPITGTRITLFKRMPDDDVDRFVREVRYVLGYWCEHSTIPILFEDRVHDSAARSLPETADPFAAFEAAETPDPVREPVNRPFGLDGAELSRLARPRDDLEIAVGLTEAPRYGYYNGGLTLVNSVNRDVLGTFAERLGHLALKVRSDDLEHTLTRDNVLQDAAWQAIMREVVRVADALRTDLLDRVEAACASGEPLDTWHALLAREVHAAGEEDPIDRQLGPRAVFRGHAGPLTLAELRAQESRYGPMLLHPGDGELAAALHAEGLRLVRATASTRRLLEELEPPRMLGLFPTPRILEDAAQRFLLPQVVAPGDLPQDERRLLERADTLIHHATGGRARLAMGDYGADGVVEDLVVEGPRDGRLFERRRDGWLRLPLFLRRRTLLVNRHHPHVRALAAASLSEPGVAALALSQALLHAEGLEADPAYRRLLDHAAEAL